MNKDTIYRQAAIDALVSRQTVLRCIKESREDIDWGQSEDGDAFLHYSAALYRTIASEECVPSAQPEPQWIPCSERLPEDLEEVNVTWRNNNPEPYYDFVKGVNATGTAVYYKGEWYWYSSVTVDVLAEYGRYDSEELDEAIEVVAWMPLPEPYKGVKQ